MHASEYISRPQVSLNLRDLGISVRIIKNGSGPGGPLSPLLSLFLSS